MLDFFICVEYNLEKIDCQASTFAAPRFHEMIESLNVKMKFDAKATKSTHIFCKEQDCE